MSKPQFPDVIYPLTKLSDGISRQDLAEYAALLVPSIRDGLQNYRPQISSRTDKLAYDALLGSVMPHLDDLEKYYQNFNLGKPRITKTEARKIQAELSNKIDALKQLSQR